MTLIINFSAMLAYLILTLGVAIQTARVIKRRSAQDISVWEITLRTLASIIILIKVVSIQDTYLILGQSIFLAICILYLITMIKYRYRAAE